jgi:hypothetical protein
MRPELDLERKIWLLKNPGIITEISRTTGRSASMVYQVLRGVKRSRRIAAALAAAGAPGFSQESSNARKQTVRKARVS